MDTLEGVADRAALLEWHLHCRTPLLQDKYNPLCWQQRETLADWVYRLLGAQQAAESARLLSKDVHAMLAPCAARSAATCCAACCAYGMPMTRAASVGQV